MTLQKSLAKFAIKQLDDMQGRAGCNDMYLPDNEEARELLKEYQAWNLGTTLDKVESHAEYFEWPAHKGRICCNDGVLIYVLKNACGLLTCKEKEIDFDT